MGGSAAEECGWYLRGLQSAGPGADEGEGLRALGPPRWPSAGHPEAVLGDMLMRYIREGIVGEC